MGKKSTATKTKKKEKISLKEQLRRKGVLSDNRYDLEILKDYNGPLLTLEEIREALAFLPGNLSDIIIEERE